MKNIKSTTGYQQPQQQDGNMSKANRKMNKKNLQSKQKVRTSSINSQNSNNNNNSYNTPVTTQPFSDTFNKNSYPSKAKFWEYLLDNLHATVSEVFQTCENEKSINKCNVFILYLKKKTQLQMFQFQR